MYEGEKFYLEVPIDLPERDDRPAVSKLWAQARIRDLERASLEGRRAETMKQRIVALAKEHGVSSRYTSFVVIEKRTGDRRVNEQAETRVVPVSAPADWGMFKAKQSARSRSYASAPPMMMRRSVGGPPPPARAMAPAPMSPPMASARSAPMPPGRSSPLPARGSFAGPPAAPLRGARDAYAGASDDAPSFATANRSAPVDVLAERESAGDPITAILERQSASGMWEEPGRDPIAVTVDLLLLLVRLGVSSTHPVYGAQARKAVDALLAAIEAAPALEPKLAELALGALWLLSTGRRTRLAIKEAASHRAGLEALTALLGRDDDGVRAHVERIAPV
jgi:Ca-activated chloride channel family protein